MPRSADALVTVVVPVKDGARFLVECLDTLVAQSDPRWRAVVVDDGSRDASTVLGRWYARKDARFTFVRQKNRGVSVARNVGALRATTRWVSFLDGDDWYYPDAVANLARAARAARGARIVNGLLGGTWRAAPPADGDGAVTVRDEFFSTLGFTEVRQPLALQCAFFDAALVRDLGGFDAAVRTGEDRELLVRLTASAEVAHVRARVGYYRQGQPSSKSETYHRTGEKLAATRRMFERFASAPQVAARLAARAADRARYARLLPSMLEVLDAARAGVDAGTTPARAATLLGSALARTRSDAEADALLLRFRYMIHVPRSEPAIAERREAGVVRGIARALARAGKPPHPRLTAFLAHVAATNSVLRG
jgi:hypothetical protein